MLKIEQGTCASNAWSSIQVGFAEKNSCGSAGYIDAGARIKKLFAGLGPVKVFSLK
jgi:hypothetical protein